MNLNKIITPISVNRIVNSQEDSTSCAKNNVVLLPQTSLDIRVSDSIFEMHQAIMITDVHANIVRVNAAFEKITGYTAAEVLGKNPRMLNSGRHDKQFYQEMWRAILDEGQWTGEVWDRKKNGEIYPKFLTIKAVKSVQGETRRYVAIFSDISEHKKSEEKIYNLAFYDRLTGLPNRRLLIERIHTTIRVRASDHQLSAAVMVLDMDGFNRLNEAFGYTCGDAFLLEVANRLKQSVACHDTVARLGNDEFAILIEGISGGEQEAFEIAENIRAVLAAPYQLRTNTYYSAAVIGVSMITTPALMAEEYIKQANIAMHQSKEKGRHSVCFFSDSMQQDAELRGRLASDIHRALLENEFYLAYQIQLDNHSRPVGAEALIRWKHPVRGLVMPQEFIPAAEASGLIVDIGDWLLDAACQQLAKWQLCASRSHLVLAINISAQQFKEDDFVQKVIKAVDKYHIDAKYLKLELTESVVLHDIELVVEKMLALKQTLGVTLSLDDFGTGYSSLSHLKHLPLDQLKIDKSFVQDISLNASEEVMVKTIINMAENFGLNVIAEGIETAAQHAFLVENGCMAYQGYLFSKPVPIEDFELLLKQY